MQLRLLPDDFIIGTANGAYRTAAQARAAIEAASKLGLMLVERRRELGHHILYWEQA